MNRDAIKSYIDANLDRHIARMQRWIQQPSVSWDNLGLREMAELAAADFRELGCQTVEMPEGRYYPGVWAHFDAGAPVTLHNYCMLDTRTVSPKGWQHDPFGGELVAKGPYSKVLVGRGAIGAKGPYVAWFNALEAIVKTTGTLPVNLMVLAETEEIMGSPTYREFVERYREPLSAIDASFCPNCSQGRDGRISIGLGLKGMIVVELTASGAAWGRGPANTIHSQAAALVDSPPFRLAQALATLTNPDGTGCRVNGLAAAWGYRKPLSGEEMTLLEQIAARTAGKDWRDVLPVGGANNVKHVVGGVDGLDPLINFLYGPTFNVAGLRSGFLGPESGTIPFIVPGAATATLDMRLVVELTPEAIIDCLRRHLDDHGFSDIAIDVYAAFAHSQTPLGAPPIQAALATAKRHGVDVDVWPMQAGGGPWAVAPNRFNVPCLRGGCIGGGHAGPIDEYFVIDGDDKVAGLADVEKYYVDLLFDCAEALATRST